jgi:perosamine synthetase
MFSFGPIKTATALGGGIFVVRNPRLRQAILHELSQWPVSPTRLYERRLGKYALLKFLSDSRWRYGAWAKILRLCGRCHDDVIMRWTKNVCHATFWQTLRMRTAYPLLQLLARRIRCHQSVTLRRRRMQPLHLQATLKPHGLLAAGAPEHSFWLAGHVIEQTIYLPLTPGMSCAQQVRLAAALQQSLAIKPP